MMDDIAKNYAQLKDDFVNNIYTNEHLLKNKPGYKFSDGVTDLYKGKILSAALKISTVALDDDERRIMNWGKDEVYRRGWRLVNLKGPWADFMNKWDEQLEQVFFNIAYPGAEITPHKGIHTRYFRVHVCLQTNPGFYFDIEGEKKPWVEGPENAFAFDDANLRHGVYYNDMGVNVPRVIAILDVKKEFYPEMFGL